MEKLDKLEVEKIDTAEKRDPSISVKEDVESLETTIADGLDLDPAARFLSAHKDVDTSHINMDRLRHKIDRNIVPIMCLTFIVQFLDKAVYNVRRLIPLDFAR